MVTPSKETQELKGQTKQTKTGKTQQNMENVCEELGHNKIKQALKDVEERKTTKLKAAIKTFKAALPTKKQRKKLIILLREWIKHAQR